MADPLGAYAKRPDESPTEWALRMVREDAVRTMRGEFAVVLDDIEQAVFDIDVTSGAGDRIDALAIIDAARSALTSRAIRESGGGA